MGSQGFPENPVRVIVTGADGFVGPHLMRLLGKPAFDARPSTVILPDRAGFARLAAEWKPDAVIHLAAVSFLPDAERDPAAAFEVNAEGTRSLLMGLRDADPSGRSRMVFISSGHVYRAAGGVALDEDSPLDPRTAYGLSKLAAEVACRLYCQAHPSRPLVIFRPFNHSGPGQRPEFAASSFARQTALIEAGRAEPVLHTGDLSVRRDFCDVRDVVRAYAMAAAGEVPPGIYNIASGKSVSLAELAEHYLSRSRVGFEVRQRSEPFREGEVRDYSGSAERLRRSAGWRPEIPLETTLDDLLEEWRRRVGEEGRGGARMEEGTR